MTARQLSILMVCAFAFAAGCSSSSSADTGASIAESTATVAGTTAQVPGLTPEPSVSENLYGGWLTPDNSNHLSFNEDDTWSFSHAEDPERIRGFGPFTFDGELLTLFTDPASKNCSPNSGAFDEVITGTYEAAITPEGDLELTDVDDLCVPRKIEFRGALSSSDKQHQRGTLVPYSPPPTTSVSVEDPEPQPPTVSVSVEDREPQPPTITADSLQGTEWLQTVTTAETEVEGGVHLDSTIRLDGVQLSVEGTASQDVAAVEMVQGAVVECIGTTYDESYLWSATQRGSGELDFGESGSVTIEFDAVIVTSTHMRGLSSGAGAGSRICGEWSGNYLGISGVLADAVGTFTAIFPGNSHASNQIWTFDA